MIRSCHGGLAVILLAGVVAAPVTLHAQSAKTARVGVLLPSDDSTTTFLPAFRQGLRDLGYVEGRMVSLEVRSANGRTDRLMADGFRPGAGGFLLDGRRERASGAYLAFRLGLDEGRPLDFECLTGDLDCMVEPDVLGLRVKESLPEESVALVRVLGVVPAPQLFDYDLEIGGRPFHQCPRRTQGFSKLLP